MQTGEKLMCVLGMISIMMALGGCESMHSSGRASTVEPLLIPQHIPVKGRKTVAAPREFVEVPAERIEPLEIIPLPVAPVPPTETVMEIERAAQTGRGGGPPARRELPTVLFSYDSWLLSREAKQQLREAGRWMRQFFPGELEVSGHADSRGTEAYNQALGLRRANAVTTYLTSLGIQDTLMRSTTFGELQPVCVEESESCYAANRRAVVVVEEQQGNTLLSELHTFPKESSDMKNAAEWRNDDE